MSIPSESEESPFDIASKAGKKQTIFLYRKTLQKADVEQVELHGKIKFYKSQQMVLGNPYLGYLSF